MKSAPPPAACSFMSYLVWGSGSCGMAPSPSARQSAPVKTPSTPGIAVARLVSMPRMCACACGERSITAQAWPSTLKSSLKRPRPVVSRSSSLRTRGRPMKRKLISPGRGFWSRSVIAGGFRRFQTRFTTPQWRVNSAVGPSYADGRGALASLHSLITQRLGEAEFVTIGVGQVKEPLAPFGVARRGVRAIAGRDHARMERVDVGMVEDDASPPGPRSLGGLGDQIEVARSSPKARKRGVLAAIDHLKSQHAIEADRARHVVGGERDGADTFDHRPSSNARGARSLGRSLGLAGDRAVGMTQIAALVAPPHVVDQRVRPLALHLEGGDQRVFRRHRHALVFASD